MNELKRCGKPAVALAYWPDHEPLLLCDTHHAWMLHVAKALSLYVHCVGAPPDQTCTQWVNEEPQTKEVKT